MGEREYSGLDGKAGRPVSGFCPGLVLDGRYRLESLLGEGGMGTVWVGNQLALQRQVAVKSLHVVATSARIRLRREALALAAVHHPAIVEVYDYGETESGLPYVVMELVRGESIAARLRRLGAFPADDAVSLVIQILDGLAVAHRAGVVHRDIKPDNVVLTSGSGARPKLLDFGIAQSERDDGTRLTLDGAFVGTPAYMAPEQMRGGVADERVDVWGVGALLYHLVAGEAPFGVRDVVAVMRRVLEEPPSYPRKALGLDGRLWGIITAALRKDPEERTPSAPAMRQALVGWLEARGVASPRAISISPVPFAAPTSPFEPTLLAEVAPTASPVSRRVPIVPDDAVPSFDLLIRAKLGR